MNPGSREIAVTERIYAKALRLYPAPFRVAYAAAMRQSLRDALADPSIAHRSFLLLVVWDLAVSLAKEHLAMIRESLARPVLVFNALVLAGFSTVLALALYAIPQQVLRQGLNDPQIAMATDMAAVLNRDGVTDGLHQGALLKSGSIVDMARSLTPFLIVYNDQGQPLGSNAQLDGQTPTPPAGVFDYVRRHGEERVSWQPILGSTRGVRIAAVVERVNGPQPGFVLAGRNMREVEAREAQVGHMAGLAWLGMLGLIVVGSLAFGWYTRKPLSE
ncbi:MAG TPA: hypothetical protein VFE01_01820 [Terracidiphilus sp.]|nr:hypothetical protein [Terracidiphilus sp.]